MHNMSKYSGVKLLPFDRHSRYAATTETQARKGRECSGERKNGQMSVPSGVLYQPCYTSKFNNY